jgi:molybdopterin converting factor small subunit
MGHDGFDLRSDDGPDLGPALDGFLSEGAGMLVGADAGAIGVVIELNEVFAPPEEHRLAGGKHGVDGDEQGFGPVVDGANGSPGPVKRVGETGHLAGTEDRVLPEGWGSGPHYLLLWGFYGHERLLQHTGFRVGRSVASMECTSASQHRFLMSLVYGWVKGMERLLARGFLRGEGRPDYLFWGAWSQRFRVGYSVGMRVCVLYFGVLKDLVGHGRSEMDLAEGASVAELLEAHRGLAEGPIWESIAVAVNQEYARAGDVLKDGDEVALLPPVSGGIEGL